MGEDKDVRFRAGKKSKRDPWFGLSEKPDFKEFRKHWHGQKKYRGKDLTKSSAHQAYEDWTQDQNK